MSFKHLQVFYELSSDRVNDRRFTHSEWAVLSVLCNRANDAGECWPGYGRIASDCFISRRQAIYSVKMLEEMKIIVKQDGRASNTYIINYDLLVQLGGSERQPKKATYRRRTEPVRKREANFDFENDEEELD